MWQDLVAVSVWGGIVALDTTAAMQILISRPLVSCSVVGLLLGSFPMGFLIGLIFELLYLDELPVGGALFTEGNVGATIAAALAILLERRIGRQDLAVPLAALAGILMSMAGAQMVVLMRHINTLIYTRLLKVKRITTGTISGFHLLCLGLMFLAGALLNFAGVFMFYRILQGAARIIPASLDPHLHTILYAFMGVGCGVLIYLFYERKTWWHLAVGLGCGIALWVLTCALRGGWL